MNDRLVKLIDYSLLPFSLTILGKTIGLYVVLTLMDIDWGVGDFPNSFISVTPIVYGKDLQTVATYSNLFMFVLLFVGFCFYLLIANLRRKNLFNSRLLRIITQVNFVNVFQKGEFLYTRIFVWFTYLWLVTLYIIIDSILGRSSAFLGIFVFILSGMASASIISDFFKEYQAIVKTSQKDYI